MKKHIIQTERLSIRTLVDEDAPFYLTLLNDPAYRSGIADRGVRTIAAALLSLRERVYPSYEANGFGMYLLERNSDGEPLGVAGLVRRDFLDYVDVGYALLPAGRGQGLATEAAAAMLKHARQDFGLRRVAALTDQDNKASIRVLERLGFQREGLIEFPEDGESCSYFLVDL